MRLRGKRWLGHGARRRNITTCKWGLQERWPRVFEFLPLVVKQLSLEFVLLKALSSTGAASSHFQNICRGRVYCEGTGSS